MKANQTPDLTFKVRRWMLNVRCSALERILDSRSPVLHPMVVSPLLLLATFLFAVSVQARVLVTTNSTWRYFKGTSEASSPTNAWRELDFDDSAWLLGAAPFHFGTNAVGGDDTLTGGTILADMRSNYTCIFLRQTFFVQDTNSLRGLWLNAWYDDGFAVWINGQPPRSPLSVSGLAYTNTATANREGSPRQAISISNAVALLRNGANVLCLQAFNSSLTNDDFRMDVELAENSPTLAFAVASTSVSESAGQVALSVLRSGSLEAVTVDYASINGTAINGLNYTAVAGTLAFGAGETNQTIVVPILNEGYVEGTTTFRVALSNPTEGAVLGSLTNALVSIADNDVGINFQFSSYSVAEDAGQVLIGVVRGDDGTLPVTADITTSDLTATNGLDYLGLTNTLSFAPQERLKFVPITILNNTLKQPNRNFVARLTNPAGTTLGAQATATVTIEDNDQGFQFQSSSNSVAEDAGAALIDVLRGTDDTNSAVTVKCATANVSATNGVDYIGSTNTLAFAPGERVKRVTVPILNNGIRQATRSFRMTLSNPTGGAVLGSPTTTTVSILDNDPGVGFEQTLYWNEWGSAAVSLTVLRGNDGALGPITVDYRTSDGTARAGVDYQAASGILQFRQNETVKGLTISLLPNRPAQGMKSCQMALSNPTGGATLAATSAVVNIFPGAYAAVAPPFDAALTIRRADGFNTLTWVGGGVLQRADNVTGPWQTLLAATNPCIVQSPFPASFYRVTRPRPAYLYIPPSYDGHTPLPLVLALHGYSGTGAACENWMHLMPLADARGFVCCYPNGTTDRAGYQFWNATDAALDQWSTGVDDAGYLRSLIEEIGSEFAVDRKRIYLIGYSNGGFMAYRMACQCADLIAGIASLAGATFLDPSLCTPSEPVNILEIHCTGDANVPYGGGAITPAVGAPCYMPAFPGAVQNVQTWAGYNGSSGPVLDAAPSLDLTTDVAGLDAVVTHYTNCPPGGAVELWTILGGSHGLHLSSQFSPLVINWLLAHPKP